MKKLLLLGGSEFQIPMIKTAKELGIYVGVVDINANAPAKSYADEFFVMSLKDREAVLRVAEKFKPDGISVGMVDVAVPTCAYVVSKLNLPGLPLSTAEKATNKFLMIQAFKKAGVPSPNYLYIDRYDDCQIFRDIEYPVIVKPIDMAGSRGIFLVDNQDDLHDAILQSSRCSNIGSVLVEEYLEGPEVSVELIIKNGEPFVAQITDKTTTGAPHFAEIGHLQPSQLSQTTIEDIKKVACAAAKSLGLVNSLGHAEIKITAEGPKMIEIGARAGGDGIAEQLIELSTGISFSKIAIQIAFGEEIVIPEVKQGAACIKFIQSHKGELKAVAGLDEVRKMCGVVQCEISGKIGTCYDNAVDNSGRWGYVIAKGENAKEAQIICDAAIEKLHFECI